jgi:transposase-like protein
MRKSSITPNDEAGDISKDEQIRQLEKQCRRLKMEQEILKKATAFFAKDQL